MGAGKVYVVGFGEAVAERDSAGDEYEVESGPLRWNVISRRKFMRCREVCAYQRC